MTYSRISRKDAEAGRSLASFLISAGYFPQIYEGSSNDFSKIPYRGPNGGGKNQRFVTVAGPNVVGAQVDPYNSWALSGNQVWYQHSSKARTGQDRLSEFMELDQLGKNIKANEIRYQSKFKNLMGTSAVQPDLTEHKSLEAEFFKKSMSTFQANSAKNSGVFLSHLNKQLAKEVEKKMGKSVGAPEPVEVEATGGALMPEEQTSAINEAGRAQEQGIGRTQPIDAKYHTVGGNIFIDVSEMTVAAGGHHGLGPSGVKSLAGKLDNIKEKDFKMIKNEVFKHYQERITVFNEGIRKIRENAQKTKYKKTSGRITPEEMRRAGFTEGETFADKRGAQRQALTTKDQFGRRLKNASAGAAAVSRKLGFDTAKKKVDKSATAFILHSLGTFNSHQGNYYHGLTVSHNPHVTTSINFRMFSPNAKQRAYEYKKLRKEKDVHVSYGYASLEILRRKGVLKRGEYVDAVRKMKNVHHGARYMRGAKKFFLDGINNVAARRGKGKKLKQEIIVDGEKVTQTESYEAGLGSAAIYIPSGWSDAAIENVVSYFQKDKGPFAPSKISSFNHQIQDVITNEEAMVLQRGFKGSKIYYPQKLSFWATPYYGYSRAYGTEAQ
tara:strand:+ start:108 stop:1934 length:1827 start_codon:yes stop_codon:yes gene_type:complete